VLGILLQAMASPNDVKAEPTQETGANKKATKKKKHEAGEDDDSHEEIEPERANWWKNLFKPRKAA
jgi:hypothetical protein